MIDEATVTRTNQQLTVVYGPRLVVQPITLLLSALIACGSGAGEETGSSAQAISQELPGLEELITGRTINTYYDNPDIALNSYATAAFVNFDNFAYGSGVDATTIRNNPNQLACTPGTRNCSELNWFNPLWGSSGNDPTTPYPLGMQTCDTANGNRWGLCTIAGNTCSGCLVAMRTCGGVMIGPNVYMTASHCGFAPWGHIRFKVYRNGGSDTPVPIADTEVFACESLFQTPLSPSFDTQLLYCHPNAAGVNPGDKYGYVSHEANYETMRSGFATIGDPVYATWQQPGGFVSTSLPYPGEVVYAAGTISTLGGPDVPYHTTT